jgi:hypothetical protein
MRRPFVRYQVLRLVIRRYRIRSYGSGEYFDHNQSV